MITYKEAQKDSKLLDKLYSGADYVEIMSSMDELLENPTKSKAKELYISSIFCWFNTVQYTSDFEIYRESSLSRGDILKNPEVIKIRDKYNVS